MNGGLVSRGRADRQVVQRFGPRAERYQTRRDTHIRDCCMKVGEAVNIVLLGVRHAKARLLFD